MRSDDLAQKPTSSGSRLFHGVPEAFRWHGGVAFKHGAKGYVRDREGASVNFIALYAF